MKRFLLSLGIALGLPWLATFLFVESTLRLRALVNAWTVIGLLAASIGALLLVDRPFLAAREIRRRAEGGDDTAEDGFAPARRRRSGGRLLLGGVVLFLCAALVWAVAGAYR